MKSSIENVQARRILIIGDAGRGKTTFAKFASDKFGIPMFSLDDILWKEKYSMIENRLVAIDKIKNIVVQDSWIVEGTTRYLAEHSFDGAHVIYHFHHRTVVSQIIHLIWRYVKKRGSTFVELCKLILHSVYKRYGIGYQRGEKSWGDILEPHSLKIVHIGSHREVRRLCLCSENHRQSRWRQESP